MSRKEIIFPTCYGNTLDARLAEVSDEHTDDPFLGTPYRALGVIGQGGMGTVFLVEHREMGKKFAAKVIHSALVPDEKAVDRFRLEAQSLGQLQHPNIVEIKGTGATAEGRPFVILEYLRGRTLAEQLEQDPPSSETSLKIAFQLLAALRAAHQTKIVHRDIKPANLFLTEDYKGDLQLKVLDFGLAKVLPDAPTGAPTPLLSPTTAGNALGASSYMSPEQARGLDVDTRADIYAAALVLYHCLAGAGPFERVDADQQGEARTSTPPRPLSDYLSVRPRFEAVVMKALAAEPQGRFTSAEAFSEELSKAGPPLKQEENTQQSDRFPHWAVFFIMLPPGALIAYVLQLLTNH